MVDIEHVHGLVLIIDEIADSIVAATSAPLSIEGLPQRSIHCPRVDRQSPEHELDTGSRRRLGQLLGRPAASAPGHDDPKLTWTVEYRRRRQAAARPPRQGRRREDARVVSGMQAEAAELDAALAVGS